MFLNAAGCSAVLITNITPRSIALYPQALRVDCYEKGMH